MTRTVARRSDFVPASELDKRRPSKRALIRGLVRQAPFVAKNFGLYFRNGWQRHILRTNVVAPYAVTFYVTHKCNLDCSYCTQKEPDVFSKELSTGETIRIAAEDTQGDGFDRVYGRGADSAGGY